jgi:prolyl-tRNA editing enzyme YbaK/EbsC (Cys-tRNA(Pro) deacylase)
MTTLHPSAQKVQDALSQFGITLAVKEFPSSTRTAQEAADSIGCTVGQIAKSLVFMGKTSGKPILIIASGSNRVDTKKIETLVGEKISKPDANYVREQTGFAIGGIPPLGHTNTLLTYVDEDLQRFDEIWAAAGTPNAVFMLTPSELMTITSGQVVSVAVD